MPSEAQKKAYQNLSKPGKTNNPNGRPPKERTFSDTARQMLSAEAMDITYTYPSKGLKSGNITRRVNLKSTKTFYHGMVAALVCEGLDGNVAAIRELVNRVEGLPPQSIDLKSGGRRIENHPLIQVIDKETSVMVERLFSK